MESMMQIESFAQYRQIVARAMREAGYESLALLAEDLGNEEFAAPLREGYDMVLEEAGQVDWYYQEGAVVMFIATACDPWNHGPGACPKLGTTPSHAAERVTGILRTYK
jgi:hypothetical protein